jgi:hypothetical protein
VKLNGEAAEIALAEAKAVLAHVQDEERRGRLADLLAAIRDGAVDGPDADALEEVLGLGLQTGRVRALYGPEGEQAALKVYRRLPAGRELGDSAREVTKALEALAGNTLEGVQVQASGPGSWTVTVSTDGLELSVKLDPSGARLATVAV